MDERDVFSFHLRRLPSWRLLRGLFVRPAAPGLLHAESFLTMQLGAPVLSPARYRFREIATLAWWRNEAALEEHLASPAGRPLADAWHVRLRLYRRWGRVRELEDAVVHRDAPSVAEPIVAITLARLKPWETFRFVRFGKPVERQVRDDPGATLALAAMRPLATFCTFSIWRDEATMLRMVQGRHDDADGRRHALAMRERARKDFHFEFTTMRFLPLREVGAWRDARTDARPAEDADGA